MLVAKYFGKEAYFLDRTSTRKSNTKFYTWLKNEHKAGRFSEMLYAMVDGQDRFYGVIKNGRRHNESRR